MELNKLSLTRVVRRYLSKFKSFHNVAKARTQPFDQNWYLESNPDVEAAGLDAFEHYQKFGQFEGRLPMSPHRLLREPFYAEHVSTLNVLLWHGYSYHALPKLQAIAGNETLALQERVQAKQRLADWYFCNGDIERAHDLLLQAFSASTKPSGAVVAGLCRCYQVLNQQEALTKLLDEHPGVLRPSDKTLLTGQLNAALTSSGLSPLPSFDDFQSLAGYSQTQVTKLAQQSDAQGPLVSIIVPVYNAGKALLVAVQSLRAQTYQHIEIILVDDASTDDSLTVMQDLASQDSRIRVLSCGSNQGAYGARNLGMRHTNGELVTVHDSDDWSHPAKLALQVQALSEHSDVPYSTTYWVRVLPDLRMLGSWMLSSPLLQLNHSSAMFRRSVLEQCGLWDHVRVAGDTEYLRRVHTRFGKGIEVLPHLPLSLSLVHPQSLTQTKATHVSTIFFGLRRLYREAMDWSHRSLLVRPQQCGERRERLIPSPLGNLPRPETNFDTLLMADFSQWTSELEKLLHTHTDDLILLHLPQNASACLDPICDQVWAFCHTHGVVFLHPGISVTVQRMVLTAGDLLLNRPDALPQVTLDKVADDFSAIDIIHPATQGYLAASMVRTMLACGGKLPSLAELFDTEFYLASNPDVAQASISSFVHFIKFGQAEGRQGFELKAIRLENQLWQRSIDPQPLHALLQQKPEGNIGALEQAYASWALARWYASMNDWKAAIDCAEIHFNSPGQCLVPGHRGPWLVWFNAKLAVAEATGGQEQLFELNRELTRYSAQQGTNNDLWLAQASIASALSQPERQFECLQQLWRAASVTEPARLNTETEKLHFDQLPDLFGGMSSPTSGKIIKRNSPLVSVIIPAYNSHASLPTALRSLLAQSWPKLEVIVVDDASSQSYDQIEAEFAPLFKQRKATLRFTCLTVNQGAYAARNRGLELATGEFITTHDADDWSHPAKIQRQVEVLQQDKSRMASMSHWVRANDALQFSYWRPQSSWIHPNMSSLMFRRKVFKQLGYWDRVSVSGDTEYYHRIQAMYGFKAIVEVLPGVPLAFGRHSNESLTQQSETHICTQFAGIRFDYIASARRWHADAKCLYMPNEPAQRLFEAPGLIQRPSPQQIADEVLDEEWYLCQYPDVKAAGANPRTHFIKWGMAEGRIPGPVLPAHQPSEYQGQGWQPNKPCIVVFAHQVTKNQFGAERSLRDVIKAMKANVVVVLPRDDKTYRQALLNDVQAIHIQPLTWWNAAREASIAVCDACEAIINRYSPIMVYVNTLTLWEPLLAARSMGIESVVHVRELPDADPELCTQLGACAADIRQHIVTQTDRFIANSQAVATYLNEPERTQIVPNFIDLEPFSALGSASMSFPLRIGMLSSNLAKKGVADVFALAKRMQQLGYADKVKFYLYGPLTQTVRDEQASDLLTMVEAPGYVEHPSEALAKLDLVLNLSHFQESFGRSVLEAMAAGRPVLCYAWGALPELVTDKVGRAVEFKDIEKLAQVLKSWLDNPAQLEKLAANAKIQASNYQFTRIAAQLNHALGLKLS